LEASCSNSIWSIADANARQDTNKRWKNAISIQFTGIKLSIIMTNSNIETLVFIVFQDLNRSKFNRDVRDTIR
jgi:hypothetical protein